MNRFHLLAGGSPHPQYVASLIHTFLGPTTVFLGCFSGKTAHLCRNYDQKKVRWPKSLLYTLFRLEGILQVFSRSMQLVFRPIMKKLWVDGNQNHIWFQYPVVSG